MPSGHTCTTDKTDFRGGVWGATSLDGKFTVGPAIQIRFQQSDLSLLETDPLTPGLSPTSSAMTTASATFTFATTSDLTTASVGGLPTAGVPSITSSAGVSSIRTTTAGSNATSSAASQPGSDNEAARHADLAAIISSTLIVTFAIGLVLLVHIRHRRQQYRQRFQRWFWFPRRKRQGLVPVGLGAWVGTRRSGEETREAHVDATQSRGGGTAAWDTETGPPVLTLEFEKQPLGALEGPAELDGAQEVPLSRRASWVSRMLSVVAGSSSTTRSSSLSRWTQRSLATSGEWERFMHPRKRERADFLTQPGFLAVPEATYSRPATMSSSTTDGDKVLGRMHSMLLGVPKVRSFDRLSDGTFGRVTVRAHSYHSKSSEDSRQES